VADDILTALYF